MDLSKMIEPTTWAFLEKLKSDNGPPIYKLSPSEARSLLLKLQEDKSINIPATIEEHTLPVGPTGKVSIRIVRPENINEALPAIMYFHGGGWVLGDKTTHDRLVREIAIGVHAAVIFVNYTPSPEAQYPIPIEEAYAATCYVAEHSKKLNVNSSRLIVVGDSVGGNMTTVVTLLAKERKGPTIHYQVLFYPVTDANFNTPSYQQFADGPWLTKPAMEWFWNNYLPDINLRKNPTASPLQATTKMLSGLPPTLIFTNEFDVLRDEGEAYAHKLIEAKVPVTAVRCIGAIHDLVMLNALKNTPACRNAIETANTHLRKIIAT